MTNHFTPYAVRREELRIETERRVSEILLGRTRAGFMLLVFAWLCLGLSTALVLKRAPEIARSENVERPA